MANYGLNLIDGGGLQHLKKYLDAQSEEIKDFLAGEEKEFLDIVDLLFDHKHLPVEAAGYEIDLYKAGRCVDYIPRGGEYPRMRSESVDQHMVVPRKMGGMSEVLLEDIWQKPKPVQEMKTVERLTDLREDFHLARIERGMLALNTAVTAAGASYIYDCAESNKTAAFTEAKLESVMFKRKTNRVIQNLQNIALILSPSPELQLRQDSAFDAAPDIKDEMLRMGALPEQLQGIRKIFVTPQMPVLYDSAGNMQDGAAAPTGVWKLPIQFVDLTDTDLVNQFPQWLVDDGLVDVADWDIDHVAVTVWVAEVKKCGVWVTQDFPEEWGPIDVFEDKDHDAIGTKMRGNMNFGVPIDARKYGVKFLIRAENIQLETA